MKRSEGKSRWMRPAVSVATLLAIGLSAVPASAATLSSEATAVSANAPLYLPASPRDPGGLLGYDHDYQIDLNYEAHNHGQNKKDMDKLKTKKPKKAVSGPKVKAGTYTLAPAPEAEVEPEIK